MAEVVAGQRCRCGHERPAAGDPRLPPRPQHLPGRRHLLPGHLQLRVRARRADLPLDRPAVVGADRATSSTGRRSSTCSKAGPSGGIFAPTLRYHDGRFWMITTNWSDDGGQLLVHADDPAGPWSEPVRIPSAMGIDPDLAWDDDGTCLMSYAGFGPDGGEGIVQSAIDPLTGEVLTERRWLWSGTGGKFPEGPHLYRIGEWWYLLIAEGGTERGHAVTIARGRDRRRARSRATRPTRSSPTAAPTSRSRTPATPTWSSGPDGSWAIVYHGVRARGSSPEWHVLGRETFADEVDLGRRLAGADRARRAGRRAEAVVPRTSTGGELPPSWVGASASRPRSSTGEDGGWRVSADGGAGLRRPAAGAPVRAGAGAADVDGHRRAVGADRPHARGGARGAGRPGAGRVGGRRHPARAGRGGPAGRRRAGDPAAAGRGGQPLPRPWTRHRGRRGRRTGTGSPSSAGWTAGTSPPRWPAA